MAVKKLMGQNFRAFVSGNAVPEATNCQVTISGNMEDSSTKDSTSGWTEEQMVSKQWSVSVDNIEATLTALRGLIMRFNSDTKIYVGWDQAGGEQNRVAQAAEIARSGQANLTDLSIQANNRSNISVTCQYTGSGALS